MLVGNVVAEPTAPANATMRDTPVLQQPHCAYGGLVRNAAGLPAPWIAGLLLWQSPKEVVRVALAVRHRVPVGRRVERLLQVVSAECSEMLSSGGCRLSAAEEGTELPQVSGGSADAPP